MKNKVALVTDFHFGVKRSNVDFFESQKNSLLIR